MIRTKKGDTLRSLALKYLPPPHRLQSIWDLNPNLPDDAYRPLPPGIIIVLPPTAKVPPGDLVKVPGIRPPQVKLKPTATPPPEQALPELPFAASPSPEPVSIAPTAIPSPAASPGVPPITAPLDIRPVLAVAEILNLTNDENLTVIVADQLANSLLNIGEFRAKFRWVERTQVKTIIAELAFQGQSGLSDPRTTKRLGQILNASQLLVGSIHQEPDNRLTINMSLLETETAERKHGITVTKIPRDRLDAGIHCLALNIAHKLQVAVSKEQLETLNNEFKPQLVAGNFWLWAILGGVAIGGGIAAFLLLGKQPAPPPTTLLLSW